MSEPSSETPPPAAPLPAGAPGAVPTPGRVGVGAGAAARWRAQADGERSPLRIRHFLGLLAGLTGLNALTGLARGTLTPSVNGLLLAPVVVAAAVWLLVVCALNVRAGRWVQGALPLAMIALLVGTLASGSFARRMIFPGNEQRLPATGPVDAVATVVEYATDDGVALRGLFVRAEAPAPRPALVYFHGNAESAASNEGFARALAARGVDVLLAEYRGYAGCPGSPSEDGLLRDARAAVREVSARTGVLPRDLVLFGRSLGTGVAAALAAEGTGRAVVLLSPYTAILDIAAEMVPRPLALLAVRDPFDSRARLLAATQPVVIFHGPLDRVIPFRHGEALASALGPRARFLRLDGCDHNDVFALAGERILAETLAAAHAR